MSEPIVFFESFRIPPGKAEEFRQAAAEVCSVINSREPQLIAYKIYASDDGSAGTALHIHPDDASLEYHQGVMEQVMGRLVPLIELVKIDICGELSERGLEEVRRRAQAFGDVSVVSSPLQAGFLRSGF